MAWYDTGTVSVTNGSTAVTGSGTNFVAGAQVGEGFYGPDGRLYEIQAIVSATSLTLADAYLGTTQTGQEYKIVPTQSLVADLASQVSTLISDYQSVADNAGEGKFQDGSATSPGVTFIQDQDTGFFRDTANEIGISAGGVKVGEFNSTGMTIDALTVSGDLTFGGLSGSLTFGSITGDLTGDVTGNVTGDLTGDVDLAAIAASKGVTAVDVFVYDTSKDSDGGAWRKRTQHTSWYNETLNTATRGARREFPAVAVIVATTTTVTIYDGDDPSLPMWMVFNPAGAGSVAFSATTSFMNTGVFAKNGLVVKSANIYGIAVADFLNDTADRYWNAGSRRLHNGSISDRNNDVGFTASTAFGLLVNSNANDVAMTVLPDAPIDPATGLPVPTIAVATEGGVSVIRDDGTVADSSDTVSVRAVAFDKNYKLLYGSGSQRLKITSSYDADGFNQDGVNYSTLMGNATGFYNIRESLPISGNDIAMESSNTGISFHHPLPTNEASGLFANVTSTYNTGWMNGDIKGAFLSDTDDTDLVGSGELVTNGTFDTDISGWTDQSSGTGSVTWNASGYMDLNSDDSSNRAIATQTFTLVVGQAYTVTVEKISGSSLLFRTGQSIGSAAEISESLGTGSHSFTFVPTVATNYIAMYGPTTASTISVDNVSLRLADADRSVNNNGLIVNGTVTRTPVATGADLVAYSGFSASNYLEQPYNSDLDFGTGDFSVIGWGKSNSSSASTYISYGSSSATWQLQHDASGTLNGNIIGPKVSYAGINDGSWKHIAMVRLSGTAYLYVNGALVDSAASSGDVTVSSATLRFGLRQGDINSFNGSLALWRISATAPTAEQIKKIYEDEKVLFQENAACTLYGTSNNVTALAHDSDTGLLHVGTSAGRSVFQGLRRVSNTTTAVGTAISASNGLVVEE